MLPRRGVKSGILQKSNSKTTVRPVFTESPAHYRQPVPLPVKAAHHPLPARSPYDIDRMYPLSSTSVARQGGREYGYASDRPDYPAPDRSRLHQPPTSSGQLSQNRSRHLDPESTRSFEAAVGMSSTDDLGTSDRGSRRPITSNSSQLIRTFSGEEAPPLAHTHMAESDVDFERTLVSLQSRMKNLQSKYLEMANYYRAELSKRKHGEAPETAAGAEMLQRLQEQNAQADQELRAVYDARQGYLNKKLMDLTGEVEAYRKENNVLKGEIQALVQGRPVGTRSRASSKQLGAKSPHTPKTRGLSKKPSMPTPPPRTLVGEVNSGRSSHSSGAIRTTGERLLARLQDLTRNLQDDIQIEQERRQGGSDLRRVFRKHLEKVKDAVGSTFDSLCAGGEGPADWTRGLGELKQQLETNAARVSKILSSLKHKASLSKLDLDKADLQLADMHGFIGDKLAERARYSGELAMLKEKLKLLEINCEQVQHRSKLAEKEVDVAQNINDESEVLRAKLFKLLEAPRSSHGRQQPQQGRNSGMHVSEMSDSRLSQELQEAQRLNTQLLEDLKVSKDQGLASNLERERLERRVQEQERELEQMRGRRVVSPPPKRNTRPSSALNESRALSPSASALHFENQEMRLKIKSLEQELRRANRSISKQRNSSQAPEPGLRAAQEESEEHRGRLRKSILLVKKFFLSFRRLQRALHKREEADISKYKVEFEACRHELRDYVDHLERKLDEDEERRKGRSFNISGVSKRSGSAAPRQPALTPTANSRFHTQQQASPRGSHYASLMPDEELQSPIHGRYEAEEVFSESSQLPEAVGGGASGGDMAGQLRRELMTAQNELKQSQAELQAMKDDNAQLRREQVNTASAMGEMEKALQSREQELLDRAAENEELGQAYNIAAKQASEYQEQVLMLSQQDAQRGQELDYLREQMQRPEEVQILVEQKEAELQSQLRELEGVLGERERQVVELEEQVEKITRETVKRLKRVLQERNELRKHGEGREQDWERRVGEQQHKREQDLKAHNLETANMQNLLNSLKYELSDTKKAHEAARAAAEQLKAEKQAEVATRAQLESKARDQEAALSEKAAALEQLQKAAQKQSRLMEQLHNENQKTQEALKLSGSAAQSETAALQKRVAGLEGQKQELLGKLAEAGSMMREAEQGLANEKQRADQAEGKVQSQLKELEAGKRKQTQIEEAHQALAMENTVLAKEKKALSQEKTELARDREQLVQEKEKAVKQKEKLAKEKDQAVQEKDQIAKEKERLAEERERAMVEKETVAGERDKLRKERDILQSAKHEAVEVAEREKRSGAAEKQARQKEKEALERRLKEMADAGEESRKRAEREGKEALAQREKELEQALKKREDALREEHAKELKAKEEVMKSVHASSATELETSLRKMLGLEAARKEEQLRQQHEEEKKAIQKQKEQELEAAKAEAEREKQTLSKMHQSKLKQDLEALQASHIKEKEDLVKGSKEGIGSLQTQLEREKQQLKKEHEAALLNERKAKERAMEEVEKARKQAQVEREKEREAMLQEKEGLERTLKAQKEAVLEQLKSEQKAELERVKQDNAKLINEKEQVLQQAKARAGEVETQLKKTEGVLKEKEGALKAKEGALKEKENALKQKEDDLLKKNEELEEVHARVGAVQNALKVSEGMLQDREAELGRSTQALRKLESENAAVAQEKGDEVKSHRKAAEEAKSKIVELQGLLEATKLAEHKKRGEADQSWGERVGALEGEVEALRGEKERLGKELNETLIRSLSEKEQLHTLLNRTKSAHERELAQQKELHENYQKEQADMIAGLKERLKKAEKTLSEKEDQLIELEKKWMRARDQEKEAAEHRLQNELDQERGKLESARQHWEDEKEELVRGKLSAVKKLQDQLRDQKEELLKQASDSSSAEQQRLLAELKSRGDEVEQLEDELMSAKMVKNSLEAQIDQDASRLRKAASDLEKAKARADSAEQARAALEKKALAERQEAQQAASQLRQQLGERDALMEEANAQLEHFNAQKMYIKASLKQLMLDCSVVAAEGEPSSFDESEFDSDIDFEAMIAALRREMDELKARVRARSRADESRLGETQQRLIEAEKEREEERHAKGQVVLERDEAKRVAEDLQSLLEKAQENSKELVSQRATFDSKKEKYKAKLAQQDAALADASKALNEEREAWAAKEKTLKDQATEEQQKAQDLQEALEMAEELAKAAQEGRQEAEAALKGSEESLAQFLARKAPKELNILRRAAYLDKSWLLIGPEMRWVPEHGLNPEQSEKLRNAIVEEDTVAKVLADLNDNYETNIKTLMEERAQLGDSMARASAPGSVSPGGGFMGAGESEAARMRANKAETEILKLQKKIGELVALIDGLPEDGAAKSNVKKVAQLTQENEQLGERYEELLKEMRSIEMHIGEKRKDSARGGVVPGGAGAVERPPARPQSVKGARVVNSPGMSYVEERAGTDAPPAAQFLFEQESMMSIRSGSDAFADLEGLLKRLQESEREIQDSENTRELLLNQNRELKKVILALEKKLKKIQNKEQEAALEHGRSLLSKFLKGAPYAAKELEQILLVAMNVLEFSEKEIAAITISRVGLFGNMKEDKKKKGGGGLLNMFQKKKK